MEPRTARLVWWSRFSIILPLIVLGALLVPTNASADCCGAICGGLCKDCTKSTPCCGHGKCNIFCCNCDGGCREGRCAQLESTAESTAIEWSAAYFNRIDRDHSGTISMEEFSSWAKASGKVSGERNVRAAFEKVDVDQSGAIEPHEFDTDLDAATVRKVASERPPISSHVQESAALTAIEDYWTEAREQQARPMPMPRVSEEEFNKLFPNGVKKPEKEIVIPPSRPGIAAMGSVESADVKERPFWNGGKLFFKSPEGDMQCSAEFVGSSRTVLTAAHCVMDAETGEWYTNFKFKRAYKNGGGQSAGVHCITVYSAWHDDSGNKKWDYALIYTNHDSGAGWLGLQTGIPFATFWSIGYPMNFKCTHYMAKVEGSKGTVSNGVVQMVDNPMAPGCSGGAWIGDLTTPHVGGNYAIGLNSFYYGNDSNSLYGPLFDANTASLLEYVEDNGATCPH